VVRRQVGLTGISYYAMNQWLVACTQPPHLAAMCVWEGASDWYRELARHGGILCTLPPNTGTTLQVKTVQYGLGERAARNPVTGALICGDETLDEAQLATNRVDYAQLLREHECEDDFCELGCRTSPDHRAAAVRWQLGRPGPPPARQRRGVRARRVRAEWLEVHGLEQLDPLLHRLRSRSASAGSSTTSSRAEDNGWDRQPPLQLQIRRIDGTFEQTRNRRGRCRRPGGPTCISTPRRIAEPGE